MKLLLDGSLEETFAAFTALYAIMKSWWTIPANGTDAITCIGLFHLSLSSWFCWKRSSVKVSCTVFNLQLDCIYLKDSLRLYSTSLWTTMRDVKWTYLVLWRRDDNCSIKGKTSWYAVKVNKTLLNVSRTYGRFAKDLGSQTFSKLKIATWVY